MKLPVISGKLRHTIIEGWLYFYTAFGVAAEAYLSTDDAYKYCNVYFLFWSKFFFSTTIAGFNALKAFRSMTFGRNYNDTTTPPVAPSVPVTTDTPSISLSVQQPKQPIK